MIVRIEIISNPDTKKGQPLFDCPFRLKETDKTIIVENDASGISCHCHWRDNLPHHSSGYEEQCLEHLNRANEFGFDPLIGFPVPEGWEPDTVE